MKIWCLKKVIFIYYLYLVYLNFFLGFFLIKYEDLNIEYRMLFSLMNIILIKIVFYGNFLFLLS